MGTSQSSPPHWRAGSGTSWPSRHPQMTRHSVQGLGANPVISLVKRVTLSVRFETLHSVSCEPLIKGPYVTGAEVGGIGNLPIKIV